MKSRSLASLGMTSPSSEGVTVEARETLLTRRAVDYLAAGPADARTLIAHVCQLPSMPPAVAEHMAIALFAGHHGVVREPDGRWGLVRDVEFPTRDALSGLSYAVVDVEATGGRADDRITEVAVVEVKDGRATTVFETLINPQRAIPSWVSRLTNISWEMVKDAPVFAEVCDQLLGVLDGRVFVAHNATFDWRFLTREFERATGRTLAGRRLCTVRMAKKRMFVTHAKAARELGFSPGPVDTALTRAVEWFRANGYC